MATYAALGFAASHALVFAHRGGSALAPENTIAAFDNARALGVDGIELDVHLARDGTVVVHHDATLERTTEGRGPVSARDARELAALGVPRLGDVLGRYPDFRVIIEMKQNTEALAKAVVGDVRAAGAVDRVCVGGFGLRATRAVRALEPRILTSAAREEVRWLVYRLRIRWAPRRLSYGAFCVPECAESTRVVSPRFVEAAHAAGASVYVWTVNDEADMGRLLGWGVDGIITDHPDVAMKVVRGVNRQ